MTDSLFNVDELDAGAADAPTPHQAPAAASASSISLYRKYRPRSFAPDELYGQHHVVNTLRNAIRLDRVAHAYLFCGPRGTGKTTTARILAKAVNCLDPDPANRPCNACEACQAINANATTDVIEIDAASNRGIDDIRELRERVKYAPAMLNTRFYIIDEAHQITGAAANAFLKTLEEPPAHTRFVLATTDPEELLQTIVSRCQRFDFRRISLDAMTACLVKVSNAEDIRIEDEAITTIARHATGSLRDALGLLDQVAVYREETETDTATVTNDLVRTVLGVSRNDRVEGLIRAIADQDPGTGLTIVNDAVEAGEDIRQLGRQFVGYIRVLMLERASGSPDADDVARELAQRFDLPGLARIATIFADIDYTSRHAAIVQLPLELAVIRACTADEPATRQSASQHQTGVTATDTRAPVIPEAAPPPKPGQGPSLKDRVRGAPMNRSAAPAQENPPPSPPDAAPPASPPSRTIAESPPPDPGYAADPPEPAAHGDATSDLDRVVERWDNIRMDVKALNRRTEALLQQADPLHVEGSQLTLVAAYPFHQKRLNDDDTRRVIEEVIERQIGRKLTMMCVSRDEAQSLRTQPASPAAPPQQAPDNQPTEGPSGRRESGTSSRPATGDRDDDDPEPEAGSPASPVPPDAVATGAPLPDASPETDAAERDQERINAAMNIFDAVIIDDES